MKKSIASILALIMLISVGLTGCPRTDWHPNDPVGRTNSGGTIAHRPQSGTTHHFDYRPADQYACKRCSAIPADL